MDGQLYSQPLVVAGLEFPGWGSAPEGEEKLQHWEPWTRIFSLR
ncbi:MAG: hypothetical protein WA183_20135 [Chthoniobacterales bacterium]